MLIELVRIVASILILLGVALGVSQIPSTEHTSTRPLQDFEELSIDLPFKEYDKITRQTSEEAVDEETPITEAAQPPAEVSESLPPLPDPSELLNTPKLQEDPVPLSFAEINDKARASIVNILCVAQNAAALGSITGTGVMIDTRGIILTNAHIAQFYLLRDYPVENSIDCVIRTGSPARNMYHAELLFLHPQWIIDNSDLIANPEPLGTGQYDYALLVITEPVTSDIEPLVSFPALPIVEREVVEREQVLLASYPAGFLGGETIQKNLYAASSISEVGQLFTFGETTIDVFSTGGTVVAQQGSSGGAVVDTNGNLVGLVVTSTLDGNTSERDLRAISSSYITRSFAEYNGMTLGRFLSGNIVSTVQEFQFLVFPTLKQLLIDHL